MNYYFIDTDKDGGTEIFFTDFNNDVYQKVSEKMKEYGHNIYDIRVNRWYFDEWIEQGYNYCIWSDFDTSKEELFLQSLDFEYKHADD